MDGWTNGEMDGEWMRVARPIWLGGRWIDGYE